MKLVGYPSVCPSTRIMFVFAVRWRISRGSRYSSQLSHSLARSADSNSRTTIRFGFQSPSNTSVLPPRTMYLPPYFSTVAPASFLYTSYPTGSTISISTITYALITKKFRQDLQDYRNCFKTNQEWSKWDERQARQRRKV